jgi:predicted helicase
MRAFNEIFVLDLHGNLMKKESPPDGGKDVNVFDIQQGVAVSMFVKRRDSSDGKSLAVVNHCDLWGEREEKYRILLGRDHASMSWLRVDRAPPFYLFKPFDSSEVGDYNQWPTIADVMPVSVTGVVTARDGFVVDFDSDPLIRRIQTFMDTRLSDSDVQGLLGLKENYAWRVKIARKQLVQAVRRRPLEEFIKPYLYRPFDERLIFWDPSVVWRPRLETMPHMFAGKNCGLIYMRQVALGDAYSHFGVSRVPVDNRAFYSNKGIMSFAPLYLYPDVGRGNRLKSERRTGKCGRYSNLDIDFVHALEQFTGLKYSGDGRGDLDRDFGPEDVLAYIYSVFHSPEYRQRYEQMLKLDFPRVPLPGNRESFASLVCLGHELLAIHLLESPRLGKFITSYKGPKNPTVEEAAWCDGTVWLDGEKANAGEGHHALKPGTIGFSGVPKDVWDFHMGGYQACHKWLKDRKGRKLSAADIAHYQSIVVAIRETLRIMGEIDQAIDVHGGWLKAFQTGNVEDGESSSRRTKSKVMQSSLNT